jgi:hypothetical protein
MTPSRLAARLREIGEEIARLQKEAEELAIAKRVFERFGVKYVADNAPIAEEASNNVDEDNE